MWARLVSAALLATALGIIHPSTAEVSKPSSTTSNCAQPVSIGPVPTATDCFFILRAAVGLDQCDPSCICDVNRDCAETASDALTCLNIAVGVGLPLACPCGGATSAELTVTGTVRFDTGGAVQGAAVTASTNDLARAGLCRLQSDGGTTDALGAFSIRLLGALPAKVAAQISFTDANTNVVVTSAKTVDTDVATVDFGDIVLPNPVGAEIALASGAGKSGDGALEIEGLPAEVTRLFGRGYDPDDVPEAFPGEFAENGQIPLESANFLWLGALDAGGNRVETLDHAVAIRTRIPGKQWIDLEDIEEGTDRIEVPVYDFDERTLVWEQKDEAGWLEDAAGTILPEDAQPLVLDGSFAGEIFVAFASDHLSFMNVDFPAIGPWTLSRMDRDKRNNDCFNNAMNLATKIMFSAKGRAAYAKVNAPGTDIKEELDDGNGPESRNVAPEDINDEDTTVWGKYTGDEGGSESEFQMNDAMWGGCGEGATEAQKKQSTLRMVANILHETAHWKDDVKKFPDTDSPEYGDTDGEEGAQLERDTFGGDLGTGPDGNSLFDPNGPEDTRPATDEEIDKWLNPDSWPPPPPGFVVEAPVTPSQTGSELAVTIATAQPLVGLGEDLVIDVTYENVSSGDIHVMNRIILEGYPLYFVIENVDSGARVGFLGGELELNLEPGDFTTLAPGQTLELSVNLVRSISGVPAYAFPGAGSYEITAVYEERREVTGSTSNTIEVTVGPGGSVSGSVLDAADATQIPGARVELFDSNAFLLDSTIADDFGEYRFPEVAPGDYIMEASKPGYLRSTRTGIAVALGADTGVNFHLTPLLAYGQLRMVLSWDAALDLDSHLWLPEDVPYHVYFFHKGSKQSCPWAELDVDTTAGIRPETITISERVGTGHYVYAIYLFSGTGDLTASKAEVQVFDSSGQLATFQIPTSGEGGWWHVLDVDAATGAITDVNEIVFGDSRGRPTPGPYDDTTAGCPVPSLRAPGSEGKW